MLPKMLSELLHAPVTYFIGPPPLSLCRGALLTPPLDCSNFNSLRFFSPLMPTSMPTLPPPGTSTEYVTEAELNSLENVVIIGPTTIESKPSSPSPQWNHIPAPSRAYHTISITADVSSEGKVHRTLGKPLPRLPTREAKPVLKALKELRALFG